MVIYVWPDGTWCFEENLSLLSWKGNDFLEIELPDDDYLPEDIDDILEEEYLGS